MKTPIHERIVAMRFSGVEFSIYDSFCHRVMISVMKHCDVSKFYANFKAKSFVWWPIIH